MYLENEVIELCALNGRHTSAWKVIGTGQTAFLTFRSLAIALALAVLSLSLSYIRLC